MKTFPILKHLNSQAAYETIDRMGEFWVFFNKTRALCLDEKTHIFKKSIIEPNLSYYSCVSGISDDRLKQYIRESEPKIGKLHSHQEEILNRFHGILKRFQGQFPGFKSDFVTCRLPSLSLFNGMAIPSQEKIILLLGMDALSELTDNHLKGYLVHELFHIYHFQRAPTVRIAAELILRSMKMPPLWGLLWTEGIACYAVHIVYPEIPEEEVLDWDLLLDQTKPLLADLAGEARRALLSASPQDIAGFFYFPRENGPNIPTGCGYYIGMLVADTLAKKHSIETLIGLKEEKLISEIDLALSEMQKQVRV